MREVAQREGRVRGGELLVDDARGDGVHAAPAARLVRGDAEEAQLAAAREERAVEPLLFVVLGALRVDFLLREGAHHLAQGHMFFGRIVDGEALRLGLERRRRAQMRDAQRRRGRPPGEGARGDEHGSELREK